MPGVSTNTTCASGRLSTPRTCVRVVCGLSETMVTFCPRMSLSSVDLPTLGRPTRVTKPERHRLTASARWRRRSPRSPSRLGVDAARPMRDAADAPAVDLLGGEPPAVELDRPRPRSGTWPSVPNTKPPTVSQSSSGRSTPSSSFSSSMRMPAVDEVARRRAGARPPCPPRSYSSTISPTSSSRQSSRVTSPAVPPYSSTTIAMWNFSACISRISSATGLVSGTKWAGAGQVGHGLGRRGPRARPA